MWWLLAAALNTAPGAVVASPEECRVIQAAADPDDRVALAVAPETLKSAADTSATGDFIWRQGGPVAQPGLPAADLSGCGFPHRRGKRGDALRVSRAIIDQAEGRAIVVFARPCGAGGAARLERQADGSWRKASAAEGWTEACERAGADRIEKAERHPDDDHDRK